MNYIDLHTHSNASDGTFTPEEVVKLAKEAGLTTFALTDHDTVKGVEQAIREAKHLGGITVIPGTELSCYEGDREIHIVGLFVNHKDPEFLKALDDLEQARELRNEQMVQKFIDGGIPLTIDELKHGNPGSVITRAHFARVLVEKHVCRDKNEAFEKYLGIGCPFYLPKPKVSPEYVIDLINKAGGTAILAHPYSYKLSKHQVEALLDKLIPAGLAGMECYYSTYDAGQTSELRSMALSRNLLVSGGSDFHGANKPDISIGIGWGNLRVPQVLLDRIIEYRNTLR